MLGPILSHNCLPNPLQSNLVYKWLVVAVAEAEAGAFRDQGADLGVGRGVWRGWAGLLGGRLGRQGLRMMGAS